MVNRRLSRNLFYGLLCVASVLLAAGPAASAPAVTPPPGTPDLSQMVLQPADFASTSVADEGYQPRGAFVAVYDRTFGPSTTTTGAAFETVVSEAGLAHSALEAQTFFLVLNAVLDTSTGRKLLSRKIARELGKYVKAKSIRIGRVLDLSVGDNALLLPISFPVVGTRVSADLLAVQRDRVISLEVFAALQPIKVEDATALATATVSHVNVGLSPQNTSPPTVSGTPSQGTILVAGTGAWLNKPTSFTYQWERCDSAGANCGPIPGASGTSYTVAASDAGSTLRVSVTATNRIGSSSAAVSAATPVVP